MNNIDIANGIVFQKLAVSKENFDDRLICQKKIYLLQSLGTDLGYTYNWYVRGPYSPSLTNYIYNNLEVLSNSDFSNHKLSMTAETNIDRVNGLVDLKGDFVIASWYELLASLLYIHNNRGSWKIGEDDKDLFEALINQKPQYNEEQCSHALNVLREREFIQVGV